MALLIEYLLGKMLFLANVVTTLYLLLLSTFIYFPSELLNKEESNKYNVINLIQGVRVGKTRGVGGSKRERRAWLEVI